MFDLDGTLLDTLRAIANAANYMLRKLQRTPLPIHDYRYLAGQGLHYLAAHALQTDDDSLIARAMHLFREYYLARGLEETEPYAGILELVTELTRRGIILAVLSNKPDDATRQAVAHFFGPAAFRIIRGQTAGNPLKPDPQAALQIARNLAVPPQRWLYLGDTRVDMLTGRAAGMFTVGATWGFREEQELRDSGAQAIIHHPLDLLPLLASPGTPTSASATGITTP